MSEEKNLGYNHEAVKSHVESSGCGCNHNKKTAVNNQWATASKASCAFELDENLKK